MNFPRFWARGTATGKAPGHGSIPFVAWRWSNEGLAEARILAEQAAKQVAAKFSLTGELPHHYGYLDRPLREEVLHELKNGLGGTSAVISRNSYGATILNCASIMFLDVDSPQARAPAPSRGGWRLFGKRQPVEIDQAPEREIRAKLDEWLKAHPSWNCRLYRTRAGFRIIVTHDVFEPQIVSSNGVFEVLGVDPLYRQLCKVQKCFRARLTPKPWRCGARLPPAQWPWTHAKNEAKFREWQKRYDELSRQWATCNFLGVLGSGTVHLDVAPIIRIHDESTRAESGRPLA